MKFLDFLKAIWTWVTGEQLPVLPPAPVKPPLPPTPDPITPLPTPSPVTPPAPTPALVNRANFETSVLYVLKNEGGFVNDPNDHGGATNYGITQATYAAYKGRAVTVDEIRHMPIEDAKAIYKKSYWSPQFERLDQGVATAIMDWGVLHGTHPARSLAEQVANSFGAKLVVDGVINDLAVDAINRVNPKAFIVSYAAAVRAYFIALVAKNPTQKKFLVGWENRADEMAKLV